jgi:tyrosinase
MPRKAKAKGKRANHVGEHDHGGAISGSTLLRNLPRLARSMTFASMVRADLKAIPNFRDLGWLFPKLCQRKSQAVLTATERARFLCAFNMVNADGTLGELVDIHHDPHAQHTSARLLPWHRIYLYLLEEALHNYHPDVCIPYWDWTKPEEQQFPSWLEGVLPTVVTPTRTINVVRSPGTSSGLASIVSGTATALAQTTYAAFASPMNGIHGSVHIWVGGTMSDASVSPADPVFWMHHANLDRLWWVWYNSAQGNHQNPALTGADAVMDPWSYTETDTRSISALGYSYA